MRLDVRRRVAVVGRREVKLSPTESALLELFLRNPNRVVTKQEIFDRVWRYDFHGDPSIIHTYVSYLRRKLGPTFRRRLRTVRGRGYLFMAGG